MARVPKRPRDSQRSRVYKAQTDLDIRLSNYGGRLETVQEIEAWVKQITGSKWMQGYIKRHESVVDRRLPHNLKIEIRDGRGRRSACAELSGYYYATLKFPKWSRSRLVVLHELAHAYTNWHFHAWHGREFCANYLELIGRWLGRDERAEIVASFKRNGVKYRRVK